MNLEQAKEFYGKYIGKKLYNKTGSFAGVIIDIVEFATFPCFMTDGGKYGVFWQVERLHRDEDRITIK